MNQIEPRMPLFDDYAAVAAGLPGASDPRVAELREGAAAAYRKQGLPHSKIEAWKYTRLRDLESKPFARRAGDAVWHGEVEGAALSGEAARIVLVDGRYVAALSSAAGLAGVEVVSLRAALAASDAAAIAALDRGVDFAGAPLAALASAYLDDGAVLRVAPGVAVGPTVEAVFLSTADAAPQISFPRLVVSVGAGASLTLVETYVGPADGLYAVDAATDIALADGARLGHYVLQAEGGEATHVSSARCEIGAGASYDGFILQIGGKTSRHEGRVRLVGTGGSARLNGAYGVRGEGHCDTTTVVDHIAPETFSDQVFKGVLDGRGHGVFQGMVNVHRDAQRIVGNQLHKGLLLSRNAEVDCKPELIIFADDVKCSHGATVGELDFEQLFFLRARGIDELTARSLLLQAFFGDALDLIADEPVREAFAARAAAWLATTVEARK